MTTGYRSKLLRDGEVILREVRRSFLSMIGRILLAAALVLGPFFFLFPLLGLGMPGLLLFLGTLLLGVLLTVRLVFLYARNVCWVTTLRLVDIDQRGFFARTVSEVGYDKVQDVSVAVRGVWQTLFRTGTVRILTPNANSRIEIRDVRNPEELQALIMATMAQHRSDHADEGTEDARRQLQKLRAALGDERLAELVGDVLSREKA